MWGKKSVGTTNLTVICILFLFIIWMHFILNRQVQFSRDVLVALSHHKRHFLFVNEN